MFRSLSTSLLYVFLFGKTDGADLLQEIGTFGSTDDRNTEQVDVPQPRELNHYGDYGEFDVNVDHGFDDLWNTYYDGDDYDDYYADYYRYGDN